MLSRSESRHQRNKKGMHMHATPASPITLPVMPTVPAPLSNPKTSPHEAGKAFESMFASILLKQMRQTLTSGQGLFGKDPGDIFGGLFDHFMSQHMTQRGSLGIATLIEKHLEKASGHK
jgi:Rod binding domain-containing protein